MLWGVIVGDCLHLDDVGEVKTPAGGLTGGDVTGKLCATLWTSFVVHGAIVLSHRLLVCYFSIAYRQKRDIVRNTG